MAILYTHLYMQVYIIYIYLRTLWTAVALSTLDPLFSNPQSLQCITSTLITHTKSPSTCAVFPSLSFSLARNRREGIVSPTPFDCKSMKSPVQQNPDVVLLCLYICRYQLCCIYTAELQLKSILRSERIVERASTAFYGCVNLRIPLLSIYHIYYVYNLQSTGSFAPPLEITHNLYTYIYMYILYTQGLYLYKYVHIYIPYAHC